MSPLPRWILKSSEVLGDNFSRVLLFLVFVLCVRVRVLLPVAACMHLLVDVCVALPRSVALLRSISLLRLHLHYVHDREKFTTIDFLVVPVFFIPLRLRVRFFTRVPLLLRVSPPCAEASLILALRSWSGYMDKFHTSKTRYRYMRIRIL